MPKSPCLDSSLKVKYPAYCPEAKLWKDDAWNRTSRLSATMPVAWYLVNTYNADRQIINSKISAAMVTNLVLKRLFRLRILSLQVGDWIFLLYESMLKIKWMPLKPVNRKKAGISKFNKRVMEAQPLLQLNAGLKRGCHSLLWTCRFSRKLGIQTFHAQPFLVQEYLIFLNQHLLFAFHCRHGCLSQG